MSPIEKQTPPPRVSVIVPVGRVAAGLGIVIREYRSALLGLDVECELRLVGDTTSAKLREGLASELPSVIAVDAPEPSWGTMVRTGLQSAPGDVLCFVSWPRTSGASLALALRYALSNRELVVRANRRTRDTAFRRLGSLLFNLECRALLGTTSWDINATPKVFWRHRSELLALTRDDELIDAEFALVCQQRGFPVVEVPVNAVAAVASPAGPGLLTALRMCAGVVNMRRRSDD